MGFIPLHGWLVHYAAATHSKCGAHISQQTDCMFPKRQCIFTPYARNKIILEQYYSWKHHNQQERYCNTCSAAGTSWSSKLYKYEFFCLCSALNLLDLHSSTSGCTTHTCSDCCERRMRLTIGALKGDTLSLVLKLAEAICCCMCRLCAGRYGTNGSFSSFTQLERIDRLK